MICLCLGAILWQTSQQTPPNLLTLIGFMTLTGLTLTRLFRRLGLPGLLGALTAGLILGASNIISSESLKQTHHIYDFAIAWAGLYLSAGITPKILTNTRLYKGVICLYIPPVVFTLSFFLLQAIPLSVALPLSFLAGTSLLLFLPPNLKMGGEIIPLCKITTFLGALFWMLFSLNITSVFGDKSLFDISIDVILFGALLEATVRICRLVKTKIAHHTVLLILAYLLALTSYTRDISPFFLAFPAGVFFSFRNVHQPLLHAPSLSDAILSFVLISFALEIFQASPHPLDFTPLSKLGFYLLILVISKIIGGLLAQRFFGFSPKTWLPLIPQGFVVFLCLHTIPSPIFSPTGTLHITVLIAFMIFTLIYPTLTLIWAKIKKDPLANHRPKRVF